MKKVLVVAGALSVYAAAAGAQSGCSSGPGQDACQMAADMYQLMAPQLGISLTGGNATLGQGGNLGGLGHFAIEVRGNVINGDIPDLGSFPTPSPFGLQASRQLPTKSQVIGLPTADVALGIFPGISLGLTHILGIDALASATYVPSISNSGNGGSNFSVSPNSNWKIGYGARVGLLQESLLVPGVAVSYLIRDVPTTTLNGNWQSTTFTVSDMAVNTKAWRVTASKSLVLFNVAVGFGQDKYDQSATISASNTGVSSTVSLAQSMTRTNYFADLGLNLVVAKLVAEVGQVSGGSVNTYNSFSGGRADKSRPYASAGLRIGF